MSFSAKKNLIRAYKSFSVDVREDWVLREALKLEGLLSTPSQPRAALLAFVSVGAVRKRLRADFQAEFARTRALLVLKKREIYFYEEDAAGWVFYEEEKEGEL